MASYSQSPQSQSPQSSQSTILISVPEYCSDNEHGADHTETEQAKNSEKPKRRNNKIYTLEKVYESAELAYEAIKNEKIWTKIGDKPKTKKGLKIYYRCNQAKFRGPSCAASICLFLPSDKTTAEVHRTMCKIYQFLLFCF
jgi:hypothetical protein